MAGGSDFYLRYYVGHHGKFGHEFLEFEFRPDGKLKHPVQMALVQCRFSVVVLICVGRLVIAEYPLLNFY